MLFVLANKLCEKKQVYISLILSTVAQQQKKVRLVHNTI